MGSGTDCHQLGARHVGGQGLQGRRALPSTEPGRAPKCPSQQRTALPAGKARDGGQPCGAGSVREVPGTREGAALPHAPQCREAPDRARHGQSQGQAGSGQAEAKAWPLLLLKGTGGGDRPSGGGRGPRHSSQAREASGSPASTERARAGGCHAVGTLPQTGQPEQRPPATPRSAHPGGTCVTHSSSSSRPPGAGGHGCQRRVRGLVTVERPGAECGMGARPREMVQDWDGAELGMVLAGLCPAAQAGAKGRCQRMGSPGLLRCRRGTGTESGAPRPCLPRPRSAGQGEGRGGRAHQRALWSLMKAVLSLWPSYSSPSDSEGPSSCQMSEGSPL